jgi:hypothetical protein
MPAVVWRLEEHCLPELVVAAVARDPDVSHAAAAPGRFPGWLAEARCPAHLRLAWPQLVTERAVLWLVLEQRNGHPDDHALTSRYESMVRAHIIRQLWRGCRGAPNRTSRPRIIRSEIRCAFRFGAERRRGPGLRVPAAEFDVDAAPLEVLTTTVLRCVPQRDGRS